MLINDVRGLLDPDPVFDLWNCSQTRLGRPNECQMCLIFRILTVFSNHPGGS